MANQRVIIEPMTMAHYDEVIALWRAAPGVGLSPSDEPRPLAAYLRHNPGLSLIAREGHEVVGAALCGHDGRRGFLHHLVVKPSHRRRGIAKAMVEKCLAALADQGIPKCHALVFAKNTEALAFWKRVGGLEREELAIVSAWTRAGQDRTGEPPARLA